MPAAQAIINKLISYGVSINMALPAMGVLYAVGGEARYWGQDLLPSTHGYEEIDRNLQKNIYNYIEEETAVTNNITSGENLNG